MKKKEVPQDDEGLNEGKFRDLCYAVDENGKYVTVHSTGWSPKNTAMHQAWEVIEEKIAEIKEKVKKGELSPIAYYMEKHIMNPKLLAQYTGIPVWKVKLHLKPKKFNRLTQQTLTNYANAFNITLNQLINFEQSQEEK